MPLDDVCLFSNAKIFPGEKWLYSADFNVKTLPHERIDSEIADIKRISDNSGIAIILAHEGRFGEARHLDFVAPYLSEKLGREVKYFPENATDAAEAFVNTLKKGDVAIMGNTRMNSGEEKNEIVLAAQYAILGEQVVIGGFGKAHRKNSSNVGILECRRGYLSTSQAEEMAKLELWKEADSHKYSVAVIGGTKKEKVDALFGFGPVYDAIIPGGIVLNAILKHQYGNILGNSKIDDCGKTFEQEIDRAMREFGERIILPTDVIIANKEDGKWTNFGRIKLSHFDRVPEKCAIVSYVMSFDAQCALARVAQYNGRVIVAGTPDVAQSLECIASNQLQYWLKEIGSNALILGGDTAKDLHAESAVVSSGGGSALTYLTTGKTAVYDALKEDCKIRGKQ